MRRVRVTTAVEKKSVKSVCVFLALGIHHAKRVRCIVLSSLACLAVHYFSHYLLKSIIFERKKFLSIKCVFRFLYKFCLKHFPF
jgi:hypothetical protein